MTDDIDSDKWIVTPSHATGSSMEGTRRYVWAVGFSTGAFRRGAVAGWFPNNPEGEVKARKLCDELNERNEAF